MSSASIEIGEDDFDDFDEKSVVEMATDYVLFPLIFAAVASILILIICGSIWGSFKLVALTLAMLA